MGRHASRSRASVALAKADRDEVCRITAASVSTVNRWLAGKVTPGTRAQLALESALSIPAHDWTLRPDGSELAPGKPPEPPKLPPTTNPREVALEHLARCRARREAAEVEGTAQELSAALESERKAIEMLLRAEQRETRLSESVTFQRLAHRIVETLTPWPDALKAVREAIRDLR